MSKCKDFIRKNRKILIIVAIAIILLLTAGIYLIWQLNVDTENQVDTKNQITTQAKDKNVISNEESGTERQVEQRTKKKTKKRTKQKTNKINRTRFKRKLKHKKKTDFQTQSLPNFRMQQIQTAIQIVNAWWVPIRQTIPTPMYGKNIPLKSGYLIS